MIKLHTCPQCKLQIYDVRQLPIRCACGYVDYTMINFSYAEDITSKDVIENNRKILKVSGYGIPREFPKLKPPEKPIDLPEDVLLWLNQAESNQNQEEKDNQAQ